jgi:hypothetical protein
MGRGTNGTKGRKTLKKKAGHNRKELVESRELTCFTCLTNALIRVPRFGDKLHGITCFLSAVKQTQIVIWSRLR